MFCTKDYEDFRAAYENDTMVTFLGVNIKRPEVMWLGLGGAIIVLLFRTMLLIQSTWRKKMITMRLLMLQLSK